MEEYIMGYQSYPYRRNYPSDQDGENNWLKGWYDAKEKCSDLSLDEPDGRDSWLSDYGVN